jgi:hypothetical protein
MTDTQIDLPWTKREIIDTTRRAAADPPMLDGGVTLWVAVSQIAWRLLALNKPGGRAPPHLEHALFQRIVRVQVALQEERDPELAFDVPLDIEVPYDPQMSGGPNGYSLPKEMN